MTLAELQPHVEQALSAFEWDVARRSWRAHLIEEREAIQKALPLAGSYGVEAAPLQARLDQIALDLDGDVTADQVPQSPVRSVPMDLITTAVVRRMLRLPATFPVLAITAAPSPEQLRDAVAAIASRWSSPFAEIPTEERVYAVAPVVAPLTDV